MFADIIYIINKRLNDHGKNWRHVYKTLVLLEYCICCGADPVVNYARESIYVIKTLKEFQFIDEFGKDQGANGKKIKFNYLVRQKSREIVALLSDEERLAEARRTKSLPFQQRPNSAGPPLTLQRRNSSNSSIGSSHGRRSRQSFEDLQNMDEESAMKLALEASKREFDQKNSIAKNNYGNSASGGFDNNGQEDQGTNPNAKNSIRNVADLLSLDDNSFSEALDSSFGQSRGGSYYQPSPRKNCYEDPFSRQIESPVQQVTGGHDDFYSRNTGQSYNDFSRRNTGQSYDDFSKRNTGQTFDDLSRKSIEQSCDDFSNVHVRQSYESFPKKSIDQGYNDCSRMNGGQNGEERIENEDPFKELFEQSTKTSSLKAFMPLPPGVAPASHLKDENIGAKPVQPSSSNQHFANLSNK